MTITRHERKRVVITGVGVVSPLGTEIDGVWRGLLEGRSGAGPVPYFDTSELTTRFAACVRDFEAEQYLDRRDAKRMDRFTQYAVVAAKRAIEHSGLDLSKEDLTRVGVEIGSAIGGIAGIEEQSAILRDKGQRRLNPIFVTKVIVNMAACQVGISFGLQGPTSAPVAACATGLFAVDGAMSRLRAGEADVMLVGGTESIDAALGLAAFGRLGALSTRNEEPTRACRPFDLDRDGTMLGEGSVVFVMETLEHARARRANILAEVLGCGLTGDAYHVSAPDPSGGAAARAMQTAIRSSGLEPDAIDYIAAHGTGTPLNDVSETLAIKLALGEAAHHVPISSNKPSVGHMLGAAGVFSVLVLVKTIQENVVHPTANLETPDPECDLDYVPGQPREVRVDKAIANAFGFGGQNASVVVGRFDG